MLDQTYHSSLLSRVVNVIVTGSGVNDIFEMPSYYQYVYEELLQLGEEPTTLLKKLIRLYTAFMTHDVRSPMPHLAGPPGVGKSESVEQLAKLLGVKLHVVNVSRINPLGIEGVEMPVGTGEEMHLKMLLSTLWTDLKDGDIVLWDEYLRAYPEIYNAIIDIQTSRSVAGVKLPKVFFVAASNSVTSYDAALEDRLLHMLVPDIRTNKAARRQSKTFFIEGAGLLPSLVDSAELEELFLAEVDPTYEILDVFRRVKKHASAAGSFKGHSVRNLTGQVLLRQPQHPALGQLIKTNNLMASQQSKQQYLVVSDTTILQDRDIKALQSLQKVVAATPDTLTPVQTKNLQLNLAMIAMRDANLSAAEQAPVEEEEEVDEVFI